MSGFSVLLSKSGTATDEHARRMVQALAPFGGDRSESQTHGNVAASWVLSSGFSPQDRFERQPVELEDGSLVLFIGRLSHRAQLAEQLAIDAGRLDRMADCELAAIGWQAWERDCVRKLYGGYTMVVVDPVRKRASALRSHERAPHLYYYNDNERLVLATSTKAIFAIPGIEKRLDDKKIADALVLNYQDSRRSYFENVAILPQGHILTWAEDEQPRVTKHELFAEVEPLRLAKDQDYIEQARDLLRASVANTFQDGMTPALSLSAGLDSSTLAVTMIEYMRDIGLAGPNSLKAFVVVPGHQWDDITRPDRLADESGPVRKLAEMYPELDVEFVRPDHEAFDQGHDLLQSYSDMPQRGVSNFAWGSAMYRRAQENRIKHVVSGGSGNGTISFAAAHILFAKWLGKGRWIQLAREIGAYAGSNPGSRAHKLLGQAILTYAPGFVYDWHNRRRSDDRWRGFQAYSAIRQDFANDIGVADRLEEFGWDDRFRRIPDRQAMMRVMLQQGAFNEGGGLLEAGKVMTGVEAFDPLSDRRLMEFCYAIPDDQFYKHGIDRRLVKRMMADKLPPAIVNAKRGDQASDWHSRFAKSLDRVEEELERLEDVSSVASRVDLARMKRVVRNWPERTPVSASDYQDYSLARYGIGRALSVARFINQVEGRN